MADAKSDDKEDLADALAAMGGSQGSSPFPDDVVELTDGASGPSHGDPSRGNPSHGDPSHGDPSRGDPSRGDPSRGDLSREEPSRETSASRPQRPVRPGMPVARAGQPVASSAPVPTLKPAPGQSARPAQPAPPKSPTSRPVQPGAPKPADTRPARPLAPSLAAPPPPISPIVPFLPGVAEPAVSDPASDGFVTDEDDDFVMPAPSPEALQGRTSPSVKPTWQPSMAFRRTIIPLCLTSSLLALSLGVGWFVVDPASIFRRTGLVMPITLLVIGGVMLGLGVLNMLAVRATIRRSSPFSSSPVSSSPVGSSPVVEGGAFPGAAAEARQHD